MSNFMNSERVYWWIAFTASLFVIGINIVEIFFGLSPFFSIGDIPLNLSIPLMLTGIALVALLYGYQFLTNLIGFLIFMVGGWSVLKWVLSADISPFPFFRSLVIESSNSIYTVGEFISIDYLFIGLVLLFWSDSQSISRSIIRLFLAELVIVFSVVELLSHVLPIDTSYIWEGVGAGHLYAAVCIFFLGIALGATSIYYDKVQKIEFGKKLPVLIVLILVSFTVVICLGMAKDRKDYLQSLVESKGTAYVVALEKAFNEYVAISEQMGKRIELAKPSPLMLWESDAAALIKEYQIFHQMLWLNTQGVIQNRIPKDKEPALPPVIPIEREELEKAAARQIPYFKMRSDSGEAQYIQIFIPLLINPLDLGILLNEINAADFFTKSTVIPIQDEFYMDVFFQSRTIFHQDHGEVRAPYSWHFQGDVKLGSLDFSLNLNPKQSFLDKAFSRGLIYITFLEGIFIAFAVGGLFILWGVAKSQLTSLAKMHRDLENTEANLTTSMQSGGIGSWIWDIDARRIELDSEAESLFGFEPGSFSGSYEDFLDRLYPDDRIFLDDAMQNFIRDPKKGSAKFDIRIVLPNDTIRYLSLRGQRALGQKEQSEKVYGGVWDETKAYLANQRLEVSQGVLRVLSDAPSLKEAVVKILTLLNNAFGIEVMVVWLWASKEGLLECVDVAYIPHVQTDSFNETNGDFIGKDITIPTQVSLAYHPLVFSDLAEYLPQYREHLKSPDRIRGGIAFPIFQGTSLAGVVELYKRSHHSVEINEDLHKLMTTIGLALGQFIQKIEAKSAQEQLGSIVTYSANGLFLVDPEGMIRSWNLGAERIFGYKKSEMIGKPITLLMPPEEYSNFEAIRAAVLMGRALEHLQIRGVRKDGGLIWSQCSAAPVKDGHGKVVFGSIVVEDVTLDKQESALILESQEKLQTILTTTEEWIWEVDDSHKITFSSPSVTHILGYSMDEILNKDMFSFLFEEDRQAAEEGFKRQVEVKLGWRKRVLRFKHKDGSARFLEGNSECILDEKKAVIGFRGAELDITEQLLIEKEKKEFISLVTHELRTPLTSIHGALGLLVDRSDCVGETKNLLEIAYRNSSRLKKLIDDLLDLQRFESHKFMFDLLPIVLDKVIQDSLDSAGPVAEKNHQEIILKNPLFHVLVSGNYERLVQVMDNFLSNAIKFSPPNSMITVNYEMNAGRIRVSVKDQGKGIPKEFQGKVFERFARAETGDARKTPGTGLGLSITKNIIDQCGGTIGFDSVENVGTTFYFELPIISEGE